MAFRLCLRFVTFALIFSESFPGGAHRRGPPTELRSPAAARKPVQIRALHAIVARWAGRAERVQ